MTGNSYLYVLVVILLCLFCIGPVFAAESREDYWAPWVTKTTTSGATINWRQETNGTGIIKYANASYYNQYNGFDKTIADAEVTQYHHVLLTGLDPNTSYKYWVQPLSHETVFNNRTFRTMPVSGPFTFIVISDTHANDNRFKYVADALNNEQDALFILHGGDFSNNDNASEWADFFNYGDGMLANYSIYTNIGNHEYHNITSHASTDAYEYRNAFDSPLNYSFDCAGIRFVVLDSPDPNNADYQNPTLAHSESRVSWLKDQLDNNMSGTFVIDHHPVWNYGRASPDLALQPWEILFQKYPISADFAGHIHSYERFSVNGIPYFIVANGGGKFINLSDGKPFPPSYIYGATNELGYLKVTVDPENNTATANEYFVASLPDYDSTTGTVINPPLLADNITFPLSTALPPRVPEPGTGGSSSDSTDSGWTSSYSASAPGASPSQTMTFALNQPITSQRPGAFTSVSVVPSGALGPTQITVADATQVDMSPLAGRQTVYIASIVLVGVNPSAISRSTITFAVAGSWLSQHGMTPEDIVLMRGHDGQWSELATSFDQHTGDVYSFTATSQDFSYFAITTRAGTSAVHATTLPAAPAGTSATNAVTLQATTPVPVNSDPVTTPVTTRTTPVPAPAADPAGPSGSPFLVAVAGIVGIVIIAAGGFFVRRWWIRRQNPALFRDYDEPRES